MLGFKQASWPLCIIQTQIHGSATAAGLIEAAGQHQRSSCYSGGRRAIPKPAIQTAHRVSVSPCRISNFGKAKLGTGFGKA